MQAFMLLLCIVHRTSHICLLTMLFIIIIIIIIHVNCSCVCVCRHRLWMKPHDELHECNDYRATHASIYIKYIYYYIIIIHRMTQFCQNRKYSPMQNAIIHSIGSEEVRSLIQLLLLLFDANDDRRYATRQPCVFNLYTRGIDRKFRYDT